MPALEQTDLTTLISSLAALTQVIGSNGRTLNIALNEGFAPAAYTHIAGAGTWEVLGNPGTLLSLNINTIGTGGVGTIYDAAGTTSLGSAPVIAVLTFGTVAPQMLPLGPDERGLGVNNGVVVVTTGNADITVGAL